MAGLIPDSPLTNCVDSREAFESFVKETGDVYFKSSFEEILIDAIDTSKPQYPFLPQPKWSNQTVEEYCIRLWNLGEGSPNDIILLKKTILEHLFSQDYDEHGVIIILQIYLRLLGKKTFGKENHGVKTIFGILLANLQVPLPDDSELKFWETKYPDDTSMLNKYKTMLHESTRSAFIYGALAISDPTYLEAFGSELNKIIDPENGPISKTAFTIVCNVFDGFCQGVEWIMKMDQPKQIPKWKYAFPYLRKNYRVAEKYLITLLKASQIPFSDEGNLESRLQLQAKVKTLVEEFEKCWKFFCEKLQVAKNPLPIPLPVNSSALNTWLEKLTGEELKEVTGTKEVKRQLRVLQP